MAAHHDTHEHQEQPKPAYQKKQALLMILVFACIVGAFLVPGVYTSVGAILIACVFIAMAARMQPEAPPDEHH
jgi:hypothetical protein